MLLLFASNDTIGDDLDWENILKSDDEENKTILDLIKGYANDMTKFQFIACENVWKFRTLAAFPSQRAIFLLIHSPSHSAVMIYYYNERARSFII